MKSAVFLTPLQHLMLNACKPYVIVTGERCTGITTGLFFKAVACEGNVAFAFKFYREIDRTIRDFLNFLQVNKMECLYNKSEDIVYLHNKKVYFTVISKNNYKMNTRNLYIEYPENIEPVVIKHIIDNNIPEQMIFTTNDKHSYGWRNPVYSKGKPQYDFKGDLICDAYSWANSLIDWSRHRFSSDILANSEDFNGKVDIITHKF